ncbi:Canalicular multispecific organic anion transporter 1 [Colletotrichum higginsianum]|uniref:Canalicular multispecific organic anion transporter 1 n=1 Tax=Colletotrichum higginsianum TaxID=80884 RepID=A0A4T0VWU8_9PEZI|nr:Canalicular multispecific organic anion transporter 1 [Colletotrichum higginsianum]
MHPTLPQILSIATSALFLSLLPIRLLRLRTEPIKVVSEHRGHGKLAIAISLSVVQLATLVTTAFTPAKDDLHLVSAVASFTACVGLCPLLALEHTRSVKPSDLGIVYLLASTACDFAELGTSHYGNRTSEAVTPGIVNLFVKFVLLIAESRGKKPILRDPRGQQSPEELANILDRTFFWWINPILALGNRHVLAEENLPPMGHMLSSKSLRQQALRAWDQRAKPEGRTTLPKILALSMLPQFLAPIIPRLFLIVFRYAQPVLISTAIRYMSGSSAQSVETGHLIIAMAVVIYVGLAMSRAVYYHRLNQLKVMIRGAVVGLINNKSFSQQSSNHDDGRAVTLISTDAGNVGQAASMFHETWAQVIEVLLGTTMLAREVGWVCLVPYVIIFFCSRMSRYLAKHLQSKQKDWSMATQKRLAVATSMLSSMKNLKMLGVATHTQSLVQDLRLQELNAAKKVRWMMVAYNASANALGIFTPIVTFVLFVLVASLKGSALDTETAFTTTALLGLVTHPANMIMSIVPQAIGSLAAFERIQDRGLNLSGGQRQRVALARAVYARCEMVFLDDSFSALDGKTESRIVENLFGPTGFFRRMGTTVFLVANSSTHFHLADSLVILDNGTVAYQGTWAGLTQDPEHVLKLHIDGTEKNVTEEDPQVDKNILSQSIKVDEAVSDLSRATGDASLYGYYLRAVGLRNFLLLLVCTSSYSFFITFPQYWLQKWTAAPASQTMFYVGGYIIVSFLAWAFTNGSMWSTHIRIAPESGANLHRRLLSTIVRAPLSYFSTTDTGVILNRQDIQLVDRQLPPAILSISNQVFKLLVQLVLLLSAQKLMVEGVRTIRAFGWERQVEAANICSLDKSQRPAYILFCLQQWLGVVLDLMVAAIATGLISLAIFLRGTTTAGQIGMALNIVIVANASLLGLVTSWTNMEISLGAISRLKTLEADTPKEGSPFEDYVPAGAWPSSGLVELDNVTVSYNPEAVALQDVTLKVSGGQQLVVCGRTGSGKSTLLLALLRLLDVQSGTIKIDGVDLSLVPRDLIRQRCFITVSQDAFVLGQASLRFNLDPSGCLSNDTIVAALQRTNMWSHFEAGDFPPKEIHEILESPISSLPQMSTGQSQLFALARAILRLRSLRGPPNLSGAQPDGDHVMPILLLDEATSSLDPETEVAMRDIIHQEFIDKGHTVITITHRLGGATGDMQSDRNFVALLSKGKIEKVGRVEDVLGILDSQK